MVLQHVSRLGLAKYFTQRTVFDITTILQEFLGPAKTRRIKTFEFKYFLTDFCLNFWNSFQVGCQIVLVVVLSGILQVSNVVGNFRGILNQTLYSILWVSLCEKI